jgi:hypothetical protein
LLKAAKYLADGIEPPAIDPSLPYTEIRGAEKVLEPGEDWRILGTRQDPLRIKIDAMLAEQAAEVPVSGGGGS